MRFVVVRIASELLAHDLDFKPPGFRLSPGETGTVEFHNGDSFPNSESPPALARLRDARVLSSRGEQPLRQARVQRKMAIAGFTVPSTPGFLVTARTIPNFIELDAAKFEEYLQPENLQWVIDWRESHGESRKPGRELYSKFVPSVDPASLKPGQTLQTRLLFRGEPVKDIHVEATSLSEGTVRNRNIGRTDAQGRIAIPLDVAGVWKLHGIFMERHINSTEADWESFWASLTFQVTP